MITSDSDEYSLGISYWSWQNIHPKVASIDPGLSVLCQAVLLMHQPSRVEVFRYEFVPL